MANLSSKQRNLFEALHNSRAEDFKTFNKKSYRGVWSSIIDKYPESAHFVYEILQNADARAMLRVILINTYLTNQPNKTMGSTGSPELPNLSALLAAFPLLALVA